MYLSGPDHLSQVKFSCVDGFYTNFIDVELRFSDGKNPSMWLNIKCFDFMNKYFKKSFNSFVLNLSIFVIRRVRTKMSELGLGSGF